MPTEPKMMIEERIPIPQGINVDLIDGTVKVKGPKGEMSRRLIYPRISLVKNNNELIIRSESNKKGFKRVLYSYKSHLNNMILGVTQGFTYKLKICSSHFPISAKVDGDNVVVSNFLGEKTPRKSKILPGVSIAIQGDQIIVTGNNIEDVGQTASNLEIATKIKGRDRRVFGDGVYIVEKL